jgi:hypothetical protein
MEPEKRRAKINRRKREKLISSITEALIVPEERRGSLFVVKTTMDYDGAAELLKTAIEDMFDGGFPKEELPLLLADFTTMTSMVAAGPAGVLTIMGRMRQQFAQAEHRREFTVPVPRRKGMLLPVLPPFAQRRAMPCHPPSCDRS